MRSPPLVLAIVLSMVSTCGAARAGEGGPTLAEALRTLSLEGAPPAPPPPPPPRRGGRACVVPLGARGGGAAAGVGGPPPGAGRRARAGAGAPPAARAAAAARLGNLGSDPDRDRALPALLGVLADPAREVRLAAVEALSRLRDPRAAAALARRLPLEDDPRVLAGVCLAVGSSGGGDDSVRAVAPLAAHADPRVRAAAATALGDLGGAAARGRLLALLASPGEDADWTVRGAVLLALAQCGRPEDAGAILVAYRDGGGASSWFARAALARAVAALDPDPVPLLDRLVADPDPRVSSAAAVAFARAGRPEEVVKRLSDVRPGVRAAAAAAVADAELRTAIPRVKALAASDPVRAVRWSAALALSRLDDPSSDALLLEGVGSDDPQVWAAAIAECARKTGRPPTIGRDVEAWRAALAARRAALHGG